MGASVPQEKGNRQTILETSRHEGRMKEGGIPMTWNRLFRENEKKMKKNLLIGKTNRIAKRNTENHRFHRMFFWVFPIEKSQDFLFFSCKRFRKGLTENAYRVSPSCRSFFLFYNYGA